MAAKLIAAFLFFFCLHPLVLAQDQFEKFTKNGKVGLLNIQTSEVIFNAEFDDIGWSKGNQIAQNGIIGVKQNEKWALASTNGTRITRHYFSELYPFIESKFIVGTRGNFSILNDYGLIDAKGNQVVPNEFQWIEPVGEHLIVSKKSGTHGHYGLLNKNGKVLIPIEYDLISRLDENTFSIQKNGLSAIANGKGEVLSDFQYETILRHDESTFRIKFKNKQGLIDKEGKLIIEPNYKAFQYKNGAAKVLPYNRWTIVRPETPTKIVSHDQVWALKDHLAVQTGDFAGIIDTTDHYVRDLNEVQIIQSYDNFLALRSGEYQGVISNNGSLIIPYQYDSIQFFQKVIFAKTSKSDNQNWIPFDLQGKRIGLHFYENVTLKDNYFLAYKGGKYGLLDGEGYEKSPFIFDSIGSFNQNLAVAKYQGHYGVIKPNGNWLLTPYKDKVKVVGDRIFYEQGTESGLLDLSDFPVQRHSNPLTIFSKCYAEKTRHGFMLYDFNGDSLINSTVDSIYQVATDFIVLKNEQRFELFDLKSKRMSKLAAGTQEVRQWSEGLISIQKDNEWGFVSEQGNLTIANRYQEAKDFHDGMSAVKLNGKWGFINPLDQIVIQPVYEEVESFQNGLALVRREGKFGLVDLNGVFVLDLIYDHMIRSKNYILLEKDGLFGLAAANGVLVRSPQFTSIQTQDNHHFIVERNGKVGVLDIQGKDILSTSYDLVKQFGNSFAAMEEQTWTSIDLNKKAP
uniref:WG repeat-containing protein n=4 Tax=Roseivirga sp. TaxID=1964215 RepID=UPI004047528A